MAKATAQHLKDAGFRPEQFGTPADFDAYLAAILTDASTWVSDAVGDAVYAAATTGVTLLRLKRAEICYTKAELWRRRAAFIDSNAQSGLEGGGGVYLERREFLAHAAEADTCAQYNVDLVNTGGDAPAVGSGVSMGYAETGPFPVTQQ